MRVTSFPEKANVKYCKFSDQRSAISNLVGIEICARHDIGHVWWFRNVFVIAQNVHGIFSGRHGIVTDISRTVPVVLAIDFGFRRSFDAESCGTRQTVIVRNVTWYCAIIYELFTDYLSHIPSEPVSPFVSTVNIAGCETTPPVRPGP